MQKKWEWGMVDYWFKISKQIQLILVEAKFGLEVYVLDSCNNMNCDDQNFKKGHKCKSKAQFEIYGQKSLQQ